MAETEQRYLVRPDAIADLVTSATATTDIIQGYIPHLPPGLRTPGSPPPLLRTIDETRPILHLSESAKPVGNATRRTFDVPLSAEDYTTLKSDPALVNSIRVRLTMPKHGTPIGYITMKGRKVGARSEEVESTIPARDAVYLLRTYCKDTMLRKKRHDVGEFELDIFDKEQSPGVPLVIAERELKGDMRLLETLPEWAASECTSNRELSNYALSGEDPKAMGILQRQAVLLGREPWTTPKR